MPSVSFKQKFAAVMILPIAVAVIFSVVGAGSESSRRGLLRLPGVPHPVHWPDARSHAVQALRARAHEEPDAVRRRAGGRQRCGPRRPLVLLPLAPL